MSDTAKHVLKVRSAANSEQYVTASHEITNEALEAYASEYTRELRHIVKKDV
jgi:hypothetical protein